MWLSGCFQVWPSFLPEHFLVSATQVCSLSQAGTCDNHSHTLRVVEPGPSCSSTKSCEPLETTATARELGVLMLVPARVLTNLWRLGNGSIPRKNATDVHYTYPKFNHLASLNISHIIVCFWSFCRVLKWLFLSISFSFIVAFRSEDLPISLPGHSWKSPSPHTLSLPYYSSRDTKEQSCLHVPCVISSVQQAFGRMFSDLWNFKICPLRCVKVGMPGQGQIWHTPAPHHILQCDIFLCLWGHLNSELLCLDLLLQEYSKYEGSKFSWLLLFGLRSLKS